MATILVILGTVCLIPVLVEYFNTGLVPKIPTFLTSIFFYICSIQSFFGGLILGTIVKKDKQNFEIKLNEFRHRFNELNRK